MTTITPEKIEELRKNAKKTPAGFIMRIWPEELLALLDLAERAIALTFAKLVLEQGRAQSQLTLPAGPVPKGYKMVPVRPTRDMLIAAGFERGDGEEQWEAMLAAAPQPPSPSPAEEVQPVAMRYRRAKHWILEWFVSDEDVAKLRADGWEVEPLYARPPAADADELSAAARDVLAERRRQQEVEGWTPERDDKYISCDLAAAAATYALCTKPHQLKVCGVDAWPWPIRWWKPTTYRRNLEKAGALILAEIERIDRAALRQSAEKGESK